MPIENSAKPGREAASDTDEVGVLSYPQEQMWLTDQLLGSAAVSAPTMCVRVRGALDLAAVRRAVDAIAERHQAFRTTFSFSGDALTQRVAAAGPVDYAVEDFADDPVGWRDACVRQVRRGFDLKKEFPLRVRVYRLADDDHVLLAVRHHIVGDGRSDAIFAEEFALHYRAFADGRRPEPTRPPVGYLDYARRSRVRLTGDRLAKLLDEVGGALSEAAREIDLPLDRPRPRRRTGLGDSFTLSVPPDVAERVQGLARQSGTSPYMVLLALFRVLLWRSTGQSNVAVATPVESRTRSEWSDVIGCFLNTLMLAGEVAGDDTATDLVQREKLTVLEAFSRQELPYALVAREWADRVPRLQVVFTYQVEDQPVPRLPGMAVEAIDPGGVGSQFELMVKVVRDDPAMRIQCAYDDEIFDEDTVRDLMDRFVALVAEATAAPQEPVGRLAAVTAIGRRSALAGPPDQTADNGPIRVLAWSGEDDAGDGPDDPIQRMIAELWARLRIDASDVHRSLLESGGHSLTVAKLAILLSEDTGLEVSVADLFAHQTIAEQARFFEGLLAERLAGLDPEATAAALAEIA